MEREKEVKAATEAAFKVLSSQLEVDTTAARDRWALFHKSRKMLAKQAHIHPKKTSQSQSRGRDCAISRPCQVGH